MQHKSMGTKIFAALAPTSFGVSLIQVTDVFLRCGQVVLVVVSIIFGLLQIRKIRLEINEKNSRKSLAPVIPPSDK